ncbi:hypothetical protein L208DRAFT_1251852 [Tricholoma matsutake]|nr:hypothetical protein L208DRAFT_1251852 [Tricholoma matsutake 945]
MATIPPPGQVKSHKPQKPRPKLPLSIFNPPNTGTSDVLPLASPSNVHPTTVIDANVISFDGDLSLTQWKKEAGQVLGGRLGGVVLSLSGANLQEGIDRENATPIISLVVPFNLEDKEHTMPSSPVLTSLSTVFHKTTPEGVASLKWALECGRPVDIDLQAPISDAVLEDFEDIVSKASYGLSKVPPIVLSNILPPPHDLELPIVKLMNHPTYLAFQSQTAALSLLPNLYVKYIPPSWNAPTPPTPSMKPSDAESKHKQEWKRRIKMYLSPVVEAFGYQRIIFGSSPCPTSKAPSNASDWYEIARESLAELGIEQESIDAVFFSNAKAVYGSH